MNVCKCLTCWCIAAFCLAQGALGADDIQTLLRGSLHNYFQAVQEADDSRQVAQFGCKDGSDTTLVTAFASLTSEERRLVNVLVKVVPEVRMKLCPDLARVSDQSISQLLNAVDAGICSNSADVATMQCVVANQSLSIRFVSASGVWKMDIPSFFHFSPSAGSERKQRMTSVFDRERAVVVALAQKIEADPKVDVFDEMAKLEEQFMQLEDSKATTQASQPTMRS